MNFVIVSVVLAWLVNQFLKMAIAKKPGVFWRCGGMPSSHAAFASALYTAFGLSQGFTSPVAILALALGIIIVHDVLRMRKTHTLPETAVGIAVGSAVVLLTKVLVYY